MSGWWDRARDWYLLTGTASALATLRVVVGLVAVVSLLTHRSELIAVAGTDPLFFSPVGVWSGLGAPLPPRWFALGQDLTLALGVAWCAGAWWRITAPAFSLGLLLVWTYRVSWGVMYHDHHLLILHVWVLSLSPAAAAWSLDATGSAPRGLTWIPAGGGTSRQFGWPVRLLGVVTLTAYALAGFAKWWDTGFAAWTDGEVLRRHIGYVALTRSLFGPDQPGFLTRAAIQAPNAVLQLGAAVTLVLELGAPLALLHRGLLRAWVLGLIAMHLGIYLLMGISFPYQTSGLAFLSFFLSPRRPSANPSTSPPTGSQPP